MPDYRAGARAAWGLVDLTQPNAYPSAVLFDLDGTLIDSEHLWASAQRELLESAGARWSPEFTKNLVGVSLIRGATYLQEVSGLMGSPEQIVAKMVSSVSSGLRAAPLPWRDGIPQMLNLLTKLEVPAAIVTSSYRPIAEAVLAGAPSGSFAGAVAGDEVDFPKPHPEPYLQAAELLGVPIESCLIVEDSPTGVASALASGGISVAIPHEVPVAPASRLSRLRSAAEIDQGVLERLRAGEIIDTVL